MANATGGTALDVSDLNPRSRSGFPRVNENRRKLPRVGAKPSDKEKPGGQKRKEPNYKKRTGSEFQDPTPEKWREGIGGRSSR